MIKRKQQPPLTNFEAEQVLLGSLLIDDSWLATIRSQGLKPEDFTDERHQRIFQAMLTMDRIDEVLLAYKMREMSLLTSKDDIPYFFELMHKTPTSYHCLYYAKIVKELSNRRAEVSRKGKELFYTYKGIKKQDLTEL